MKYKKIVELSWAHLGVLNEIKVSSIELQLLLKKLKVMGM